MTFVSLRPFAVPGVPLWFAITIASGTRAQASAARPDSASITGGKR